jgi:hypothetical protein
MKQGKTEMMQSNKRPSMAMRRFGAGALGLSIACILGAAGGASALSCNDKTGRYVNHDVFPSVKQTSNIQFGHAVNPLHNNADEKLFTDIFQPNNDTCTKRPLVIFMWGGGFQTGQRQDETGDCQNFAKRGFVCATTDYRKGNGGAYSIPNFCGPTYMSSQDTRAAIRFFKMNAAAYGIDSSLIFVGGCSSGAYAAMHTAYWELDSEIPRWLDAKFTTGGAEGVSGNPGHSSRPTGVLSLSGGLFDSNWVAPGSVPAAMVGCTQDPYESMDSLGQNGNPPFFVSDFDFQRLGRRFKNTGVQLLVKSVPGNCHCPHPNENGTDGTIDFLAKSAYTIMTTQTTSVRPAVAFQPRDLGGEGVWMDAAGRRADAASFRPGVYFRKAAEGAAADGGRHAVQREAILPGMAHGELRN